MNTQPIISNYHAHRNNDSISAHVKSEQLILNSRKVIAFGGVIELPITRCIDSIVSAYEHPINRMPVDANEY